MTLDELTYAYEASQSFFKSQQNECLVHFLIGFNPFAIKLCPTLLSVGLWPKAAVLFFKNIDEIIIGLAAQRTSLCFYWYR